MPPCDEDDDDVEDDDEDDEKNVFANERTLRRDMTTKRTFSRTKER